MRRPRNGERPTPAGWSRAFRSRVTSSSISPISESSTPRQRISELTGALAFMADWRDRMAELIAHAENGDLDAIMEAESAVAAYLLAADALREWRGAA
jgi:hypothetical protein